MAATVLTIPTLVDVSLGTAETGTVNFNVLRSLFHVIVQQLDLKDVKVVFRGNDSETVQGLIVGLKEKTGWQPDYTVLSPEELVAEADDHGGDEAEAKMVDGAKKRRHPEPAETAYFVESGKVVNRTKGEQRRSQVSASSLARLEGKVKVLQNQIEILGAQAMPSDEALLEATRSSNEGQPIQNLWQNINITKRMSGAEEGIDKLASLLETVAKEYADLKIVIDKMQAEFGQDMTETINQIKMAADYARKLRPREQIYASYLRPKTPEVAERELRTVNAGAEEGESGEGEGAEGAEGAEAEEPSRTARAKQHSRPHHHAKAEVTPRHIPQQVQVEKEVERPWSASSKEGVHSNGPSEGPPGSARGSTFSEQSAESTLVEFREGDITPSNLNRLLGQQAKMKEDIEYVTAQVNTLADFADIILPEILEGLPHMEELKHKIAKLRGETGSQVTLTEEELEEKRRCLTLEQRMEDVETGLAKHWAMLRRQDATICDRTGLLATRIGSIEMDVQIINKKLHIGMDDEDQVANEELANNPVIRGIAAAGEELASNIKDMTEAIAEMFADKEASDRIVNALAEQVELMNTSKANRFEMDDILAEKADCNQLSDKVALRQFDNLCNFFRESLTEVAQKMEAYERMVQGSMLDLQHGLDTKFDKEEAATLRQSVERNLNVVKQRLDKIDTVKHGNVAAVAKKELMTDLACLSCGRDAVMYLKDKPSAVPPLPPAAHSIHPFIAFSLDKMKQIQAKNPSNRTMIQYEDLVREYLLEEPWKKGPMTHVCNRYEGGSETRLGGITRLAMRGPRHRTKQTTSAVVTSLKEHDQ